MPWNLTLPAIIPDIFRDELIIGKVQQYYDENIYNELVDKYSPAEVSQYLKERIKVLAESFD